MEMELASCLLAMRHYAARHEQLQRKPHLEEALIWRGRGVGHVR